MNPSRRMQQIARWGGLLFLLLSVRLGAAQPQGMALQATYQFKSSDLTTEKIWAIDPSLRNPHLQRWALGRHTELLGLKTEARKGKSFGVVGHQVRSASSGYIRGPGPWYRPWEEFDCAAAQANDWFAQSEGAELAVTKAAELWAKLLRSKLPELEVLLSQVRTQSEALALDRGEQVFRTWIAGVENVWRKQSEREARADEWTFYRETARASGVCRAVPLKAPPPASRMEVVQGEAPSLQKLLARAPARLWNGLFSIRANVSFAGRTLNGRFLVDSTAPTSQVSPEWLDSQGIYPAWIYAPGGSVEGVQRSGMWKSERPLARRVRAERVEVSGLVLPLREFLLTETDFFNPPENVGSCCDGVLGLDFLSLYPVEFRSVSPPEVKIWPREGFRGIEGSNWIELSELPSGEIASSCSLPFWSEIQGVSWDLANPGGLQIHTPWQLSRGGATQLVCGELMVAKDLQPRLVKPPRSGAEGGLLTEKNPGMSMGISVLSHGTFTLDLPHGRMWFAPETLPLREQSQNTSGLRLAFEVQGGERVLRVVSIGSKSPAKNLIRDGLKAGTVITQVDSIPAEDIDLWEVNRRLAGAYGPQVTLQWEAKKGLKNAPIQVRLSGSAARDLH